MVRIILFRSHMDSVLRELSFFSSRGGAGGNGGDQVK